MFQYVAIGLVALTALIIIINIVKGLLRGLKKTIGTLVAIVISALVAWVLTGVICNPESSLINQLIPLLEGFVGEGDINDVLSITELREALSHYASMIAAPFIFFVLYIVISLIISIVVGILVKIIPPHKKPGLLLHRLGGVGVGLVCGVLVTMLVLMPVVGVLNIAGSVGESESLGNSESEDEVTKLLGEISDSGVVDLYSTGCGWMFDYLASSTFDGEKIYLKDDIGVILSIVDNVGAISGDITAMGDAEIASLRQLVNDLDTSTLLKHTLAGLISKMAGKWMAGETFIGMPKIDAGELLNPLIDTMLEVISTSDKSNITADMTTLVDILDILQKHDILANTGDYEKMLELLGESDAVSELLIAANKNERMSSLSDEITKLSVRALASAVGIPVDDDDRYNMLMDDIAKALNDSYSMSESERAEYVNTNVSKALNTYGVEVSGDVSSSIASGLIADLGAKTDLDRDDIIEFFTMYAVAQETKTVCSKNGVSFDMLSDESGIVSFNPDGTISVGGRVLENYTEADYKSSSAYKMGESGVDLGNASDLYSVENMSELWESLNLINLDDILSDNNPDDDIIKGIKKYSDCEDPEAAARDAAEMIKIALKMANYDFSGMTQSDVLAKLSELLDSMKDAEIYMNATGDILKAVFQSEMVTGALKLSISEMNNFTDKLNAGAGSTSYAEMTQTISNTVEMINKVSDKNATKEEKMETTQKLMSDMTTEKAELLSTMTTPSMMQDYVSDEATAEKASSSVSNLFNNMADYKTENPDADDEAYKKEAEAVNTILNLAITGASSDSESLFSSVKTDSPEGSDGTDSSDGTGSSDGSDTADTPVTSGKLDATASEYVDLIVNSDVVSKTVQQVAEEHAQEGGNPFGIVPTEEDEAQLTDALISYYADNYDPNGDNTDLINTLNAIAQVTNIAIPDFQ